MRGLISALLAALSTLLGACGRGGGGSEKAPGTGPALLSIPVALGKLSDRNPSVRALAARRLAELCEADPQGPLDEAKRALIPFVTFMSQRKEPDPGARKAMQDALGVLGVLRAERVGLRVRRPPEPLETIDELDLLELVGAHVEDAVAFADDPTIARVLAKATPGQRAAHVLFKADGLISNGGFHYFFEACLPAICREALPGLRHIGAAEHAAICARAIAVLPDGQVPDSPAALAEFVSENVERKEDDGAADLFSNADSAWYRLQDRTPLLGLLAAHIRAHPEEYFEPK